MDSCASLWPRELGIRNPTPHIHEKSTRAHPLDPQKDGVQWWIKRCGGSQSLRTQISYMGIDAYSAEEFWLKYGHTEILPREHLFRLFFFSSLKHTPPSHLGSQRAQKEQGALHGL